MRSIKEGNWLRLIAIFLVAVTVVLTVGFAARGMQGADNNTDKGETENESSGDGSQNEPPAPPKLPDYLSYLTGLEITEKEATERRLCYVLSSLDALYGISSAELVVELPTENGDSRILTYIDENVTVEPKIGSITKTRDYISNIASFFGGLIISSGNDDSVEYSSIDVAESVIDLVGHVGYYYTENESKVYTNKSLVEALLLSRGISLVGSETVNMPFVFNDYFAAPQKSAEAARNITVQYAENNTTRFSYSSDGKYTVAKNGVNIVNNKTGGLLSYENVFVIFADATTYERIDGTQTVMDTKGSGVGYYFTEGTKYNLRWYCDDAGSLVFLNDSGTRLSVNRGTSYIAYAKSTMYPHLQIEA